MDSTELIKQFARGGVGTGLVGIVFFILIGLWLNEPSSEYVEENGVTIEAYVNGVTDDYQSKLGDSYKRIVWFEFYSDGKFVEGSVKSYNASHISLGQKVTVSVFNGYYAIHGVENETMNFFYFLPFPIISLIVGVGLFIHVRKKTMPIRTP